MAAWSYRKKPRFFDLENEFNADSTMEFDELCGVVKLSELKNGKILEEYRDSLEHGDVLDFAAYRGVGKYIVEPIDADKSDFYCWKTIEEMGYGVPPCFGDAPRNYYEKLEIFYVWKSTELLPSNDPIWDEVEAVRNDPTKKMTASYHSPIILDEFPHNYVYFIDGLEGGTSWISLESFKAQQYAPTDEVWNLWKERATLRFSPPAKSARSSKPTTTSEESATKSQKQRAPKRQRVARTTKQKPKVDSEDEDSDPEEIPAKTGKRKQNSRSTKQPPPKRQRLSRKAKQKTKYSEDEDWSP